MSDENNFKPTLEGYKPLRPFNMFMKNNFPFVENTFEALDTYGLICELIKYLNVAIDNVNTTEENISLLNTAFGELNDYVSHYFENLDVQEEINNKLDQMAIDGTLYDIIRTYTDPIVNQQNIRINEQDNRINQQDTIISQQNNTISNLTSRMNTFTELTEGSTTGDAELADARISRTGMPYSNAGENIRQSTQNNFNEFNNYSVRTRTNNLFNKNDCLVGYAINITNGNLTVNADYTVTNFIKIEGATVHRCTTGKMAWYDEDKDFISGVEYTGAATQTKPEGAVYMRTSIPNSTFNSNINNWWVADNQDVARGTPYYKYEILEDKIHNQRFNTLEQGIETQSNYAFKDASGYVTRIRTNNKLDKNACVKGYSINVYGQLVENASYYASPFIEITSDTAYRSGTGNMAWYDSNKNFLSYVSYQGTAQQSKPSGAVYLRTSIDSSAINTFTVGDGEEVASGTPYYNYALNANINKNTARIFKKVVCIGDSFTSGYIVDGNGVAHDTYDYSWPTYMENITGNKYINCSLGGVNSLTWQTSTNCYSKALASGKAQAYIIGLGLNDASDSVRHVDVGTIDDIGTNAQTYYGGISQIINKMLAISPNAKIFLQTIPRTNETVAPYNTAIRNIVSYYNTTLDNDNIFLLDLYEYYSMYSISSITGDAWYGHYTAIGYEQFAEILNYVLSDYINTHISSFQDVAFIDYDN